MPFWKKKKPAQPAAAERDEFPEEELFPEDDLESITRDLPTGEAPDTTAEPRSSMPEPPAPPEEDREEAAPVDAERPFRAHRPHTGRAVPDTLEDEPGESPLAVKHPLLRRILLFGITGALMLVIVLTILSHVVSPGPIKEIMETPSEAVAVGMTPIQSFFSSLTESLTGYFRTLKLRANIENEYNNVLAENERLVYLAHMAAEYQIRLSQFDKLNDEIRADQEMQPLVCNVVGRDDGSYFSTFTINRGSNDGIKPFMAVTYDGYLVGYTETVSATRTTVRTVIDSDASIAAMIQTSRDQGTITGTLGIDGRAMCRMYYLPDDHLPRPGDVVITSGVGMSFPRGIPIGTVRESTRGMDANKQYVVVEPSADFQHIEHVIVYLYQPDAIAVERRETTSLDLVPLETARPVPTLRMEAAGFFGTSTPAVVDGAEETPAPSATPTPEPTPTETPRATPVLVTPVPEKTPEIIEYVQIHGDPTPTPTSTPTPSPTPFITLSPEDMILEDD